jgi:glucosamine--fructose-6-phosphate aminotransferase (isomerizing)
MLVHNGIIENYLQLGVKIAEQGYHVLSETDTEIAACVIDSFYDGDPVAAIRKALACIRGSYAFVSSSRTARRAVCRAQGRPLLVAPGEGENFVVSMSRPSSATPAAFSRSTKVKSPC